MKATDSLFTRASQLHFPLFKFFLKKCSPSLAPRELARGSPWSQTVNGNSLQIPNKPIFAGEISDSLFQVNSPVLHSSTWASQNSAMAWKEARQLGIGQEFTFLTIWHVVCIAREELSNRQGALHLGGVVSALWSWCSGSR